MCNLYSETKWQAAIRALTRAMRDNTGNLPPLPGIFPDYPAPIVRTGSDGVRELTMARWGMPSPVFAKKGALAGSIVDELRKGLDAARNAMAEARFKAEVKAGRIQFRLRLDGRNWRMPFEVETTEPVNARQVANGAGGSLEKSLFAPVYEAEFNRDERDVAVYLDGQSALAWWHRNVARSQYGIQGWKRARVYPDFIFAVQNDVVGKRICVLETKGDQLDNLNTAYKRDALAYLSHHFCWDDAACVGQLQLVHGGRETVQATLILMSEWRAQLPRYVAP